MKAQHLHATSVFDWFRSSDEAKAGQMTIGKFLAVILQLGLVLYGIYLFQIEQPTGFIRLFPLIFGGFVVHAVLPFKLRMPFFVVLSFAAIITIFGVINGAVLMGIGAVLIVLCHLPIAKWMRVTLLVIAGIVLTAMQARWLDIGSYGVILPILGSMFMFRLALYIYDLDNEKKKATLWERLAYFFMLPNTVFPFFPIIDYIQFRRTYYNQPDFEIYQKGILWMLRGAIQLIGYRVVYYYFTPAIDDVQGLGGLLLFIGSAYLLYLRVSGLFHLIVGLMALFGFNLPETHRRYFLASSFNDYWRRINIYWKDFMMKMFFYPVYMRCRNWGPTNALVFSTFVVFGFTWLLHSYQWFWLQGDFPLLAVDGFYWGILGVAVAINSVWESKRQKKGALRGKKKAFSAGDAMKLALRTVATLVVLSLMWSFWSSHSIAQWWAVMQAGTQSGLAEYGWLMLGLAGLWAALVGLEWLESKGISIYFEEDQHSFSRNAWMVGLAALVFVGIGSPQVNNRFGAEAATLIASVQETRLNERDQAIEERGYYEGLMDSRGYTSQLWWSNQPENPDEWKPIMETDLIKMSSGLVVYELLPSLDREFKNAPFRTNQFGLRDQEYTRAKPDSTYRIALLGASYEQGAGVAREQTYEQVLEDTLNATLEGRFEVLNFAVGGYSPVQNVVLARDKVFDFEPDLVIYAMYATEERRMLMQLANLVEMERDLEYPLIEEIFEQAEVAPEMEKEEIRNRLRPYGKQLLQWSFNEIGRLSAEQGVPALAVYVPTTREEASLDPEWHPTLTTFTRDAGFITIDLKGVYGDHEELEVALAAWDQHPNVKGHQLIAKGLFEKLTAPNGVLRNRTD